MAGTIIYRTPPCVVCKKTHDLEIDYTSFKDWQQGTLIQDAFPDMPRETRELLITGTCPDCWETLWEDDA